MGKTNTAALIKGKTDTEQQSVYFSQSYQILCSGLYVRRRSWPRLLHWLSRWLTLAAGLRLDFFCLLTNPGAPSLGRQSPSPNSDTDIEHKHFHRWVSVSSNPFTPARPPPPYKPHSLWQACFLVQTSTLVFLLVFSPARFTPSTQVSHSPLRQDGALTTTCTHTHRAASLCCPHEAISQSRSVSAVMLAVSCHFATAGMCRVKLSANLCEVHRGLTSKKDDGHEDKKFSRTFYWLKPQRKVKQSARQCTMVRLSIESG